MQGWIKLYRSIMENEFYFSERFTKTQAWIDLLLLANHKAATVFIRGIEVHLQQGELCYSQLSLAKRWKWNVKTVNKYLSMLENRQMVENRITRVTTIITIKKWRFYQGSEEGMENKRENRMENKTETNKNVKHEKNVFGDELITYLKENNILFDEGHLRARVNKALTTYDEEDIRYTVNDAVESWKRNGNSGNFVSYLFTSLENNYERKSHV